MKNAAIALLLCLGSLSFADTLTLNDGSRHDGTVESVATTLVTFSENGNVHNYHRSNVRSIEFNNATSSYRYGNDSNRRSDDRDSTPNLASRRPEDSRPSYRPSDRSRRGSMNVPAGTEINVITNETINSTDADEGQTYSAEVSQDVLDANGRVPIPKGSDAALILRHVESQGTVSGTSEVVLDLDSVRVNGHRYMVSTEDIARQGKEGIGKNKRTATMVGGGAVLGTLIGAIAGGGKGAAIGAATGAAAGGATQVITRGKDVKVPAETNLKFRLDEPLRLNEAR